MPKTWHDASLPHFSCKVDVFINVKCLVVLEKITHSSNNLHSHSLARCQLDFAFSCFLPIHIFLLLQPQPRQSVLHITQKKKIIHGLCSAFTWSMLLPPSEWGRSRWAELVYVHVTENYVSQTGLNVGEWRRRFEWERKIPMKSVRRRRRNLNFALYGLLIAHAEQRSRFAPDPWCACAWVCSARPDSLTHFSTTLQWEPCNFPCH